MATVREHFAKVRAELRAREEQREGELTEILVEKNLDADSEIQCCMLANLNRESSDWFLEMLDRLEETIRTRRPEAYDSEAPASFVERFDVSDLRN